MNKVEIIGWLAGLPDGAPELARVDAIRKGEAAPAAPAPVSTRLLSMGAAAAALGVSRQTVWRLVKEKKLPTVEIRRGRTRIPEAGLREFVEGRRHA
ncbi:MAG: helix-turn-helix domain-containing protein [Lentisphaerae bacterium]|nr:helix-turn-helix domain-containing protein [Lentisphaerota bacterium]